MIVKQVRSKSKNILRQSFFRNSVSTFEVQQNCDSQNSPMKTKVETGTFPLELRLEWKITPSGMK